MNTYYLFQYIADRLQTRLLLLTEEGVLQDSFQGKEDLFDFLAHMPQSVHFFLEQKDRQLPTLSSVNQDLIYAAIPMQKQILLLGPVRLYSNLSISHTLHVQMSDIFSKLNVNVCEFNEFLQAVLLLHNAFQLPAITKEQLLKANCSDQSNEEVHKYYSDLVFSNREEGLRHNPYSQELRMLSSIEMGDLELLKSTFADEIPEDMGTLAQSFDRNYKNICISVITLISRAAIRGGVNPELAFSLCDSYIMKIEDLKILDELSPLVEGAKIRFATMVHDIKAARLNSRNTRRHPVLEQSKDYIFSHLHQKITMQELARELNISPNYLSELFRKHEGISFSDFVAREKISLAKNMLIYSPYSYSEISTYLGFSSQSHLGKQFKALTGMTLKQFRDTYSTTEFHRLKSEVR